MKTRSIILAPEEVREALAGCLTTISVRPRHQPEAMGGKQPKCPFGEPGTRLWVRETWGIAPAYAVQNRKTVYRATESLPFGARWKSSGCMPRWASRIEFEVLAVDFGKNKFSSWVWTATVRRVKP